MRAHLTRRYRIAAAHRLHSPALDAEENRRVYGKCNNPVGHGHDYGLEVTVAGPVDAYTGRVCDVAALDAVVTREVLARFDHQDLDFVPELAGQVPTTESLCAAIDRLLRQVWQGAPVVRVEVRETWKNSVALGDEGPEPAP
jgi:6-pyruvoyltetrahydropterin/6-carboxytetrahydropterin synthase